MSNPNGTPEPSPRQRYRKKMARRQAKVYGIAIISLTVVLAIALLGAVGIFSLPFSNDFSHKVVYADVGDTPCVPANARPQDADGMQLQVLNASSLPGVAGSVAEALGTQGYQAVLVDNANQPFRGNVQIEVAPSSVRHAYTVARYFEGPVRIHISKLPDNTMTIILGEAFQGVPSAEKMQTVKEDRTRLQSLPECLPVDPAALDPNRGDQSGDQSGQSGQSQSAE